MATRLNRPHYPPAGDVPTALARALRDGHPVVLSLFDLPDSIVGDLTDAVGSADTQQEMDENLASRVWALAGPGQTGRHHPAVSHEAGATDQGGMRSAILAFIEDQGARGATAAELVAEGLAVSVQLAGARLQELRGERAGFDRLVARVERIHDGEWHPRTRSVDGGRAGIVHVATCVSLPDHDRFAAPPVRELCPCCGQVRKHRRPEEP